MGELQLDVCIYMNAAVAKELRNHPISQPNPYTYRDISLLCLTTRPNCKCILARSTVGYEAILQQSLALTAIRTLMLNKKMNGPLCPKSEKAGVANSSKEFGVTMFNHIDHFFS